MLVARTLPAPPVDHVGLTVITEGGEPQHDMSVSINSSRMVREHGRAGPWTIRTRACTEPIGGFVGESVARGRSQRMKIDGERRKDMETQCLR